MKHVGMPRGVNQPRENEWPSPIIMYVAMIMMMVASWGVLVGIMMAKGWRW